MDNIAVDRLCWLITYRKVLFRGSNAFRDRWEGRSRGGRVADNLLNSLRWRNAYSKANTATHRAWLNNSLLYTVFEIAADHFSSPNLLINFKSIFSRQKRHYFIASFKIIIKFLIYHVLCRERCFVVISILKLIN